MERIEVSPYDYFIYAFWYKKLKYPINTIGIYTVVYIPLITLIPLHLNVDPYCHSANTPHQTGMYTSCMLNLDPIE